MPNFITLLGKRFGRLTVIKRADVAIGSRVKWECLCECGGTKTTASDALIMGKTKSCGCLQREATAAANVTRIKHGHARNHKPSPEWRSWKSMLDRCSLPSMPNYHLYGGRGITVCEQWRSKDGFAQFFRDVGARPAGHSLDRINSDGNYEPGNTRWATAKQQSNNRRDTPKARAVRAENLKGGRRYWPRKQLEK